MSDDITYYKVLGHGRQPCHGGDGQWPYRKWTDPIKPIPCKQGWHVCTLEQLHDWLGPTIWEVEVRGVVIDHGDKHVAEQARLIRKTAWDDRNARLFAADCAEHVLHMYEQAHPRDIRPRQAIETARAYANGDATQQQLDTAWAAAHAARAAAWAAERAAACAAERAASSAADRAAASAAAWAATAHAARDAGAAARNAASAAARAAERRWQTERLAHYLYGGHR